MAAGPFVFSDKTKLFMFSASGLLGATAANYRLGLVTSSWTPAPSTDEKWADLSANEIAGSGGYSTGGGALANVVLNQTGGVVKFTSDAFVWTASGGGIAAWRYGVVYYLGTLNTIVNPLVGYFLGDSTPANVPATTAGNTLTVTPNASGILTAT